MVQKAPNARQRFEAAALALFQDRGVARTTVPDIAARAQLTERTFYRYFSDKREVLFWRAGELRDRLVGAVAAAPAQTPPLAAVTGALEAIGDFFDTNRPIVTRRQALIAANPDFLEREMLKAQALTLAIGAALESRGVAPAAARMVAEAGAAIWRVAYERWIADATGRDFAHHIRAAREDLHTVMTTDGRA